MLLLSKREIKNNADLIYNQALMINNQKEEINSLSKEIETLKEEKESILKSNSELKEYISIKHAIKELKDKRKNLELEIQSDNNLIKSLEEKLKVLDDIEKLRNEKIKIENLLKKTKNRKDVYDPRKIIICAYTTFFSDEFFVSPFVYYDETSYNDNKKECLGYLYKSLDERWIIGFTGDYEDTLHTKNPTDKDAINAKSRFFITLSEACQRIGSEIYKQKIVTLDEVMKLFNDFFEEYYFSYNSDYKVLIKERKPSLEK